MPLKSNTDMDRVICVLFGCDTARILSFFANFIAIFVSLTDLAFHCFFFVFFASDASTHTRMVSCFFLGHRQTVKAALLFALIQEFHKNIYY